MDGDNFDPLTYATQQLSVEDWDDNIPLDSDDECLYPPQDLEMDDHDLSDNESSAIPADGPIDVLDLPQLASKPPLDVLMVIIGLLSKGQETNFGGADGDDVLDVTQILKKRSIDEMQFYRALAWLRAKRSPLGGGNVDGQQLAKVSLLAGPKVIGYLTALISSPLEHLWSPAKREQVIELASQVISENSGRTARSGFVRTIEVPGLDQALKLKEPSMVEGATGMKTWGSSLILAEKLVKNHNTLIKEPVLEVGAGTGLVGIVCQKLGYDDVTATDLPNVIKNLQEDYELNGLDPSHCKVLDWKSPQGFGKYSTVLMSDTVYSNEHPKLLQNVINETLAPGKDSRVLIEIPVRARFEDTRESLWELLEKIGLKEVASETDTGFDDFGETQFLYKAFQRE